MEKEQIPPLPLIFLALIFHYLLPLFMPIPGCNAAQFFVFTLHCGEAPTTVPQLVPNSQAQPRQPAVGFVSLNIQHPLVPPTDLRLIGFYFENNLSQILWFLYYIFYGFCILVLCGGSSSSVATTTTTTTTILVREQPCMDSVIS